MEVEMILALLGIAVSLVVSLHLSARLRGERVYLRELKFKVRAPTPIPVRVRTDTPVPPLRRPLR